MGLKRKHAKLNYSLASRLHWEKKGVVLVFKLTDHFLVPKHEIVPKEEAQGLLKQYGLTLEKFPQILLEDPIIEEICAKRGDIIKITRKSHTAGESIYFRVVA